MPYQRIILAIDQDDVSSQALLKAIQLAKKLQAELKIIHVVDEVIITRLKGVRYGSCVLPPLSGFS